MLYISVVVYISEIDRYKYFLFLPKDYIKPKIVLVGELYWDWMRSPFVDQMNKMLRRKHECDTCMMLVNKEKSKQTLNSILIF